MEVGRGLYAYPNSCTQDRQTSTNMFAQLKDASAQAMVHKSNDVAPSGWPPRNRRAAVAIDGPPGLAHAIDARNVVALRTQLPNA